MWNYGISSTRQARRPPHGHEPPCSDKSRSTAFICTSASRTTTPASGSARARSSSNCWPAGWSSTSKTCRSRRGWSARRASARRPWPWPGPRRSKQELYIYQCTADTRPEDLLVTPVLAESGKIAYHASPLVTAMLRGGVCILDEGNRMNEKSWASLAPLLDHRRYVESIVAGITHRGPSRLPLRRDDEPGRIDLRDPRLHPQPPAADAAARLSQPPATRWRSCNITCRSPSRRCWR